MKMSMMAAVVASLTAGTAFAQDACAIDGDLVFAVVPAENS